MVMVVIDGKMEDVTSVNGLIINGMVEEA